MEYKHKCAVCGKDFDGKGFPLTDWESPAKFCSIACMMKHSSEKFQYY